MHIFGNMLFLWIFGDNLENLIGHVRYAVFYLLCGIAAATGQESRIMGPDSIIPMLGALRRDLGVLAVTCCSFRSGRCGRSSLIF